MKGRTWSHIALWGLTIAIASGCLIFISTSKGLGKPTSLTAQEGQEIVLNDNLRIVVGKVENGTAELNIYETKPSSPQNGPNGRGERSEPDKNPCPCSCPAKKDPGGKQ